MVYCGIRNKKIVNRGFLTGPYCPIYGFGAMLIIIVLSPIKPHPIKLFMSAVILTTTLEYATSVGMERLFDMRWWDYSNHRFNINGRVCAFNSFMFGILSIMMIYIIQPFISHFISGMDKHLKDITAAMLTLVFTTDMLITINNLFKIKDKLGKLKYQIEHFDNNSPEYQWFVTHAARFKSFGEKSREQIKESKAAHFAINSWLMVYKLFWLSLAASAVGYITNFFVSLLIVGKLYRSTYAPFSYEYGITILFIMIFLKIMEKRKSITIFISSVLISIGIDFLLTSITSKYGVNYKGSFFGEPVTVKIVFVIIWGMAGVCVIRFLYPVLSSFINRIPEKVRITITLGAIIFVILRQFILQY